jgi:nicotinate phosphoribosyltransferase
LDGLFCGDAIYDETHGCPTPTEIIHPADSQRSKHIPRTAKHEDLLQPVYRGGRLIASLPTLQEIQTHCRNQIGKLHPTSKRLQHPHEYPAGVERSLHERKLDLIKTAKAGSSK